MHRLKPGIKLSGVRRTASGELSQLPVVYQNRMSSPVVYTAHERTFEQ